MNTPMTATHVFYSESENCIIDTCQDSDPPRSHIKNETLEEIRSRYPDAQYMEWNAASSAMEERHNYAKIGDRYFTLRDSKFTAHDEIIRRCEQYKSKN